MSVEITAKVTGGESVTATYDFGDSVEDAIGKFTGDVVFTNAIANMKVTAQSIIRRALKAGKNAADIQAIVSAWKPGVAIQRVSDPMGALRNRLKGASPEERKGIIAEVKELIEGTK